MYCLILVTVQNPLLSNDHSHTLLLVIDRVAVLAHVQLRISRKLVADLLRKNEEESARICVEAVMHEEQMLEAYKGAFRV